MPIWVDLLDLASFHQPGVHHPGIAIAGPSTSGRHTWSLSEPVGGAGCDSQAWHAGVLTLTCLVEKKTPRADDRGLFVLQE